MPKVMGKGQGAGTAGGTVRRALRAVVHHAHASNTLNVKERFAWRDDDVNEGG